MFSVVGGGVVWSGWVVTRVDVLSESGRDVASSGTVTESVVQAPTKATASSVADAMATARLGLPPLIKPGYVVRRR